MYKTFIFVLTKQSNMKITKSQIEELADEIADEIQNDSNYVINSYDLSMQGNEVTLDEVHFNNNLKEIIKYHLLEFYSKNKKNKKRKK